MNEPLFKLQIVDRNGIVAQLPAGSPLEADLIERCTQSIARQGLGSADLTIRLALREGCEEIAERCVRAIVRRGIGFWRTEAHVTQDIRDGLREALSPDLLFAQRQVAWHSPEAAEAIRRGLTEVFNDLKDETRRLA